MCGDKAGSRIALPWKVKNIIEMECVETNSTRIQNLGCFEDSRMITGENFKAKTLMIY